MTGTADFEQRLAALEARMDEVAADASAARHLAALQDRDLANVEGKVDLNRSLINAIGERLADVAMDVRAVRAEMADGFATTAAGQQTVVELLNALIQQQP